MNGGSPSDNAPHGQEQTGRAPGLVLTVFGGLQVAQLGPERGPGTNADPAFTRWRSEVFELGRRRRKLALLVYLHGTTRPVSRDLLLELLWSEEDPERARHSLNEALSHLRRVLGRDALGPRGGDVRLAPEVPLQSDLAAFDQAVLRADAADVVARYAGPFLDGVFVDRAPRFEMWVANERERRRREFVAACETLCATPLTEHSAPRRALIARRWLEASPGSMEAARTWIDALSFSGTGEALRAGLAAYEQVAREVQVHDEEPLPPELTAVGDRLRAQVEQADVSTQRTVARAVRPVPPESPVVAPEVVEPPRPPAAHDPQAEVHESPAPSRRSSDAAPPNARTRRYRPVATAATVIAMLLAVTWGLRQSTTPDTEATRPWILVAPVSVTGAADTTNVAGAIGVALTSALSRYPTLDVVPPSRVFATLARMQRPDSAVRDERTLLEAAERIGAGIVAFPEAATLGRNTVFRVRLLTPDGTPADKAIEARIASDDGWLEAVDQVVADLVRYVATDGLASRPSVPLPAATTSSLPALRAYAAAGRAQARRAWSDADVALRQAVALDSGFARAWADLGVLYSQLNKPKDADEAFTRALDAATGLAPRERLLVRLAVLREQRQIDAALREVNGWLLANPGDRELRGEQASLLSLRGDDAAARRAFESLLAVDSLDPSLWTDYAAAFLRSDAPAAHDSAARAYERAARLDSAVRTDAVLNNQWGGALVRAGRLDSAARIFSLMLNQPPWLRARGLRSLAHLALWRQQPADALPPLREALLLEERAEAGATTVVRTRLLLAVVLDRSGDTTGARVQRDSVRQRAIALGLQEPLLYYLLGKEQVRHGEVRAARAIADRLRAVMVPANPRHRAMRLLLDAELDAAGGRWTVARARADSGVSLDETSLTLDTQAHVWRRVAAAASDSAARRVAESIDRRLAARQEFGWEGTLASMEARGRVGGGVLRDAGAVAR
jgi:DNA-binding SARP family transcriptional activator